VKRVSIIEKCKDLVPEYLRFISGVIETDDLPLNVSREILQQNTKIPAIKKQVAKKVLGALQGLAKSDNDKYLGFYQNFGAVLKEGFHYDNEQHEALADLVRFKSNRTGPGGWVSFQEYIDRKGENQKDIYYITGHSYDAVTASPHLEELVSKGLEVLFLIDPIDEWFLMSYPKFGEYNLKAVHKGDLDVSEVGTTPENEKKEEELPPETLAGLIEMFRTSLGDAVKDVKISKRLRESPCCLVADEQGMSAQMERMMKAMGQAMPASKPILEINPTHPLVQSMSQRQRSATPDQMKEWVEVLYDTALLSEGSAPRNPGDFAKRINRVLEQATAST
jgi:molecular chaperone HtpG